jgi:hypothetical protein
MGGFIFFLPYQQQAAINKLYPPTQVGLITRMERSRIELKMILTGQYEKNGGQS